MAIEDRTALDNTQQFLLSLFSSLATYIKAQSERRQFADQHALQVTFLQEQTECLKAGKDPTAVDYKIQFPPGADEETKNTIRSRLINEIEANNMTYFCLGQKFGSASEMIMIRNTDVDFCRRANTAIVDEILIQRQHNYVITEMSSFENKVYNRSEEKGTPKDIFVLEGLSEAENYILNNQAEKDVRRTRCYEIQEDGTFKYAVQSVDLMESKTEKKHWEGFCHSVLLAELALHGPNSAVAAGQARAAIECDMKIRSAVKNNEAMWITSANNPRYVIELKATGMELYKITTNKETGEKELVPDENTREVNKTDAIFERTLDSWLKKIENRTCIKGFTEISKHIENNKKSPYFRPELNAFDNHTNKVANEAVAEKIDNMVKAKLNDKAFASAEDYFNEYRNEAIEIIDSISKRKPSLEGYEKEDFKEIYKALEEQNTPASGYKNVVAPYANIKCYEKQAEPLNKEPLRKAAFEKEAEDTLARKAADEQKNSRKEEVVR